MAIGTSNSAVMDTPAVKLAKGLIDVVNRLYRAAIRQQSEYLFCYAGRGYCRILDDFK
jgi:hypothetical protein